MLYLLEVTQTEETLVPSDSPCSQLASLIANEQDSNWTSNKEIPSLSPILVFSKNHVVKRGWHPRKCIGLDDLSSSYNPGNDLNFLQWFSEIAFCAGNHTL